MFWNALGKGWKERVVHSVAVKAKFRTTVEDFRWNLLCGSVEVLFYLI